MSPGEVNSNGNTIFPMQPTIMGSSPLTIIPNNIGVGGGGGLFDDLTLHNTINSITSTTTTTTPQTIPTTLTAVKLTALDKNGINVILVPQKIAGCLQVLMTATNNSLATVEQFLFQAAVPKSFTLQMLSPSGSLLPPGGTITQEMRLTNSAKVNIEQVQVFKL